MKNIILYSAECKLAKVVAEKLSKAKAGEFIPMTLEEMKMLNDTSKLAILPITSSDD